MASKIMAKKMKKENGGENNGDVMAKRSGEKRSGRRK